MSNPRKIVLLCPFDLDRLSGTPVRAKTVARCLAGICDSLVLATGGVEEAHLIGGVWSTRRGSSRFSTWRFAVRTFSRLRVARPAALHVMTTGAVTAALLYKVSHPRCRIVFESHGLMRFEMATSRAVVRLFYSLLDRIGVLIADTVIVMSHTQAKVMRELRMGSSDKFKVIWGPVDTDSVPAEPPPELPLRIGYLGNDHFWQGVDTVLEAARLLEERSDITFTLAGFENKDHPTVPPGVVIEGPLPEEEGSGFLSRCHVLLSPRIGGRVTETQYPHKLSYYLAAGRPVVVSDVSDQPRVVTLARCGTAFRAGDSAALADAIRMIADLDSEQRVEMGNRARAFAEDRLSLQALREHLIDLYGLSGDTFVS